MIQPANQEALTLLYKENTLTKKTLATLDGEIADPEITVKLEMRDVIKVHDEQT